MRLLPAHRGRRHGTRRAPADLEQAESARPDLHPVRHLNPIRATRARLRARLGRRGQSLVELAVVLPVLLVLLGGAIDLGRAFFAKTAIENAAKEGAFFGATRPNCDDPGTGCADPANVEWHVVNESDGLAVTWTAECFRAGVGVSLTACEADDTYRVTVNHRFTLVTPLLGALFGSGLDLSSTANAVVFSDAVNAGGPLPVESTPPGPSDDPEGECLVPNFIGLKANNADDPWEDRGFTGPITEVGNGNFTIAGQSLQSGTWWACTSGITISNGPITPSPAPTVAPTAAPTPTAVPTPTQAAATPTPTPLPTASPTPNCRLVPTLEGFSVSAARTKWRDAGFTGAFTPSSGQNNKTVITQTTNPTSRPGDCIPPNSTVTVTHS